MLAKELVKAGSVWKERGDACGVSLLQNGGDDGEVRARGVSPRQQSEGVGVLYDANYNVVGDSVPDDSRKARSTVKIGTYAIGPISSLATCSRDGEIDQLMGTDELLVDEDE